MSGLTGFLKRSIDVLVSFISLIVLFPLFCFIAVAILLIDGYPVLYRQTRVGLGGRTFTILKFRSMRVNAEDGTGPVWSSANDPRATRLGGLLRRTGFDELPQLVNILEGDMSLVGPRPERPVFVAAFEQEHPQYAERHQVKPGLTGFSQIHGWRGSTDPEQRLRHDLHYIEHYSLALDLSILILTPLRGWSQKTRDGVSE